MGSIAASNRSQKLAALLSFCMLFGTILVFSLPAQATHPPGSCLDSEPETDTNPVGSTHTITATLRSTPSGTQCTGGPQVAIVDTKVSFEFESGPAVIIEVDDAAPPERTVAPNNPPGASTPDATCTIKQNSSSCRIEFRSNSPGTNVIRSWINEPTPTPHPIDETEGQNETTQPGGTAEPDTTDVVSKSWAGPAATLDCTPETDVNPSGSAHTVTCTARDASGTVVPNTNIDAEATGANDLDNGNTGGPDFNNCRTDSEGQCSFTHGPGGQGTTTNTGTTFYRAWIDDDNNDTNINEGDTTETRAQEDADDTDVVEKTWQPTPLNCEPETDSNPSGTAHTITCTAQNETGQPRSGVEIDAEITGANDPDASNTDAGDDDSPNNPDLTCTTDAQGQCQLIHGPGGRHSTRSAGMTTYRAWIDEDKNNATPGVDPLEGQDEQTQPGGTEPDRTDVVTKRWTGSELNCDPEEDRNPTGTAHTITCVSRAESSAITSGDQVDVEIIGANDPDASDSPETPDMTCRTGPTGCTVTHGPGGVGTTNQAGTSIYLAYIDVDEDNDPNDPEIDRTEGRTEGTDPGEPDTTDTVEKTWIAALLDCTPEADTNPARTAHTVTCSATDSRGVGTAGMQVDVEATGPNDPDAANSPTTPDFSCTTGATGTCSFTHGPGGTGTTTQFGRTLYRAWIDLDGNNATPEADPTEGRDEFGGATPSPSPTGSPGATGSPSPRPTTTSSSSSESRSVASVGSRTVAQQTSSPSPTPTSGGTASPSPAPTSGGGSPAPTPTGTPAPSGPGSRAEPDETDVVEKNWSAVPTRLTMDPESDSAPVGSCNTFTITATDAQGSPVANVVIDVEQRHESSGNATAGDEPVVSFCTPEATDGSNPSAVDPSRGDLGGGEDGTIGGEADTPTDAAGKVTIGVRVRAGSGSNGTGTVLVTAFYEDEDNDDPDTNDPQDSSTKTWTPSRARAIDCDPETARERVGREHTVICTVRDQAGQPAAGEGVTFTEDGPGDFTTATQKTSDAQGRVQASVTSSQIGVQTITGTLTTDTEAEPDTDECDRAAGDPSGAAAGVCSDSVTVEWTRGPRVTSGPCKNFFEGTRTDRPGGGQVIVGTSGADTLRGTNGDDIICGLGGKDTLIGRGGADLIDGGNRNDILRGNSGADRLRGGGGKDILAGGGGNDRMFGNADGDTMVGGGGRDVLRGAGGKDVLRGRGGNDRLRGGAGNDTLVGGRGRDSCAGGGGDDVIRTCE